MLPPEIRIELNTKLVENAFSNYDAMAAFLQSRGYRISRSQVHRYGQQIERQIDSIRESHENAQAIVEALGDEGEISEATLQLLSHRTFRVVSSSEDLDVEALGKLLRTVPNALKTLRQVAADKRLAQKVADEAMKSLDAVAGRDGRLTPETLTEIRERVYGLVEAA